VTILEIGRKNNGFTLIEVLVSFAILTSSLILIAAGLARALALLNILEHSVLAHQLADRELVWHTLRVELGEIQFPKEEGEEGFASELTGEPISLDSEPVKGLLLERAVSEVSWYSRGESREEAILCGFFPPKEEGGPSG